MWLEVENNDKIIYHLEAGETLPKTCILDGVVVHADEWTRNNQEDILFTLNSINNKRLLIKLETTIPWNELTIYVKHYIDEYYNVNTNEHKLKKEVWDDVREEQ